MKPKTEIILSVLAVFVMIGFVLPSLISAKSSLAVFVGIVILMFLPVIIWNIGVKIYGLIGGEKK